MINYVSKNPKNYVKNITKTAWTQVLTAKQSNGIRGFKMKTRYTVNQPPVAFDYAFNSSPTTGETDSTLTGNGYWTNTGSGSGDEAANKNGIWARVAQAESRSTAVLEIIAYE